MTSSRVSLKTIMRALNILKLGLGQSNVEINPLLVHQLKKSISKYRSVKQEAHELIPEHYQLWTFFISNHFYDFNGLTLPLPHYHLIRIVTRSYFDFVDNSTIQLYFTVTYTNLGRNP